LRTGDRGRTGDGKAHDAKGRRRSGDGVAGRHQVVDDHDPRRPRWSGSLGPGDELACRGDPALGRGEVGVVRPVGGLGQERGNPDRDAAPAQNAGRVPGQPLDVLAASATGHRVGGRDRNEPQRAVRQLRDRRCQCGGQWPRQVAATPLLVRQQAGPDEPGVVSGNRHRRQPRRGRVRTMLPRSGERALAPHAHGPAAGAAADAPAWEGQIGQDGEHATTVPPSVGSG
jgi:hypothetical protein